MPVMTTRIAALRTAAPEPAALLCRDRAHSSPTSIPRISSSVRVGAFAVKRSSTFHQIDSFVACKFCYGPVNNTAREHFVPSPSGSLEASNRRPLNRLEGEPLRIPNPARGSDEAAMRIS